MTLTEICERIEQRTGQRWWPLRTSASWYSAIGEPRGHLSGSGHPFYYQRAHLERAVFWTRITKLGGALDRRPSHAWRQLLGQYLAGEANQPGYVLINHQTVTFVPGLDKCPIDPTFGGFAIPVWDGD